MFERYEKNLGSEARLGIKFYLLDETGKIIAEDGYRQNDFFPMASIFKVVLALKIIDLSIHNRLFLKSIITINPSDFSPGSPTNELDKIFFIPYPIIQQKTINQLLTIMLTKSDNTATDILLKMAGGVDAVNEFAKNTLGLKDYHLTRSCKQLLSYYYDLPEDSYFYPLRMLYQFTTAFKTRPAEEKLIATREDSCTPETMAKLLQMLASALKQNNWLNYAARKIFKRMERCETGDGMIKKGILDFLEKEEADEYIKRTDTIGNKTGGVGSVRTNVGFYHRIREETLYTCIKNKNNKKWAIFSIMTSLSSVSLAEREKVIAKVTEEILEKHEHHFKLERSMSKEERENYWRGLSADLD